MSTYDLTQPVKIVNPASNADASYGYYDSLASACLEVPIGLRKGGKTVGIKQDDGTIVEYWWKNDNDLSDEGLVLKQTSSSGGGEYFKEITKDGTFSAVKITAGVNAGKYSFKIVGNETLEWIIGDNESIYTLDVNNEWNYIADALGAGVERRIDAVSYGNDGQVHYWKGTETGQASYPNVPENHILKTFITLTETEATVTIPNTFDPTWLLRTDANWNIKSIPSGDSKIILGNVEYFGGRAFKIVDSEEDSTITGIVQYSTPTLTNIFLGSDGVMIYLWNDSENDITIKNFPTGTYSTNGYRFWFPIEGDYILKPNEVIYFKWHRVGLNPVTIDYNSSKFVFLGSNMGSGGVSGDFIPLSGTEVGKPLTGNIEVDTSNGRVGFYNEDNSRFVGITDDGLNQIASSDSSGFSYLEQHPAQNSLATYNNNNQNSRIDISSTSILLNNTDNDLGGYSGELSIENYELRFDSKTEHGTELDGSLYYNAEEGLVVQNNNGGFVQLSEEGLGGDFNNKNYSLYKHTADSENSNLLFPDSGNTARRIPVSVNGVYADQQGDIDLDTGTSLTLEQARQNGNVLEGDVRSESFIEFIDPNGEYNIKVGYDENTDKTGLSYNKDGFYSSFYAESNPTIYRREDGTQTQLVLRKTNIEIYGADIGFKGLVGHEEFDKQGDRKAFAQISDLEDALEDFVPLSEKAQPNGVATLDGGGKIPATQLPNSVMTLEGEWNADTNTPTLTNGTGNPGMIYEVTTAGTTDFGDGDITFAVGDWAVYGADGKWYKSLNSNEVTSVNGETGPVVLTQEKILPSETGKFLVGGATDWEKRGIVGDDFNISGAGSRVPTWGGSVWGGTPLNSSISSGTIPIRTTSPNFGRLKANDAIETDDLVPLGQLNTILGDYIEEPSIDGTSGQVLTTDGSGGRSWTTPTGGITALTGDVTASGSGSVVATIADNAVTPEKLSEKDYVRLTEAGTTWLPASVAGDSSWTSITYGNGKFVAVANSLGTNKIMYSTDGITWNPVSLSGTYIWQAVTYGDGKFVAVASLGANRVMYSSDGINWNLASAAQDNGWRSVTYGDGKFVAVSGTFGKDQVMYSTDGINWNMAASNFNRTWYSVTYGNGKFVAVPNGSDSAMYSTDGITWTLVTLTEANNWSSVTYGDGKFVAVSTTGTNRVIYSSDGINWLPASVAEASSWTSVTYGRGGFVAVASSGTNRVIYSSDGITWNSATATEANSWRSVTYGGGKFVAVSADGTNRVMYYSVGGLNFDIPTSALINDGDGTAGQFLSDPLGGTSGQVLTTDGSGGVSWTTVSSGGDGSVTSVGLTVPTGFSVSNSPITTAGNIALSYASGYQGFSTADKNKLDGLSNYTLPTATATTLGGIELFSNTVQSVAAEAVSSTASRTYGIQLNSAGQAVVNVPWTNTTYSTMSEAEINAGTASTARTISALRLKTWLDTFNYVPYSNVTDTPTADKVVQYSNTGNVNTNEATLPNNAVPLFQMEAKLNNVVELTGDQTVAGVKTFTSSPIVPTATTATQAVNLGQVTGLVGGAIQDLRYSRVFYKRIELDGTHIMNLHTTPIQVDLTEFSLSSNEKVYALEDFTEVIISTNGLPDFPPMWGDPAEPNILRWGIGHLDGSTFVSQISSTISEEITSTEANPFRKAKHFQNTFAIGYNYSNTLYLGSNLALPYYLNNPSQVKVIIYVAFKITSLGF